MTRAVPIVTSAGDFVAHFSERGLARLEFPHRSRKPAAPDRLPTPHRDWPRLTRRALELVLAGKPSGQLPPLDPAGSAFQQEVWAALRDIPLVEVRTYAALATALGRPRAARAVGNACGANPIPLLIPCHRVVTSGGGMGGYSGPPGWKRKLLGLEGASPDAGRVTKPAPPRPR